MVRKAKGPQKSPDTGWMDTFADLLLLLITFFVLLFAMSALDAERLRAAFSFFVRDEMVEDRDEGRLAGSLSLHLRRKMAHLPAGAWSLDTHGEGVRIYLESDGLFDAESFRLRPDAGPFLGAMADVLRPLKRRVLVQGYPDGDMAGEAARALALERALAVRHYLVHAQGLPAHDLGLAVDSAFPLLYGEGDSRQRAWNRRVGFVILEEGDVR